jgi:PAS domain S-box-containing protein
MELDRNQPSASGLREALSPWFDHGAAWLVLLCVALALGATLAAVFGVEHAAGLPGLVAVVVSTLAALIVAMRSSGLHDLEVRRRNAWRWLALALGLELAAIFAVPATRAFHFPVLQAAVNALQFAFFPCAAMAAIGLLAATRRKSFGPQFWLEATLVSLCVGTVLWLALPHDLPPDVLPARASWTVGLDAFLGVLAGILLLRRSDWQGWPGLATFAFALGAFVGSRLLEAHAAAFGIASAYALPLHLVAVAGFAIAAQLDYVRAERRAPPMDAVERGSPFAALMPYAALMLAGYALFVLHKGEFGEPAGLIAAVVCIAAALLFARQAFVTAMAVARQTGLATRSAEARFNALIRNTADVIAIVTPDGTVSYVTPTAERIFGFQAQDLIGQHLEELVAFDDRARLREFFAHDLAQAGASAVMEARVPRGDERQRVVEIHGTNMESEPAIGGRLLNR